MNRPHTSTEAILELVEDELLTEDDFMEFFFANPVNYYTQLNPLLFRGTVVEGSVRKLHA